MVLLRRRFDRLAEEMQFLGENRQLARVRAAQPAVDADDVAQVELPGQLERLFADLFLADEQLDVARPVADVDEDQFAGVSQEDDSSRGSHSRADHLAPALLRFPRAQIDRILSGDFGQRNFFARFEPVTHVRLSSSYVSDQATVFKSTAPGIDPHIHELTQFLTSGSFVDSHRAGILRSGIHG